MRAVYCAHRIVLDGRGRSIYAKNNLRYPGFCELRVLVGCSGQVLGRSFQVPIFFFDSTQHHSGPNPGLSLGAL